MSCCNYLLGFDKSSIYLDNWRGKKQVFLTAWQDPWSLLFKGKSLLSWARPWPIKSWEFSAKFVFSCWHQAWPGLSVLTFWHFCLCRGEGWGWEAGLEGERGEERQNTCISSISAWTPTRSNLYFSLYYWPLYIGLTSYSHYGDLQTLVVQQNITKYLPNLPENFGPEFLFLLKDDDLW